MRGPPFMEEWRRAGPSISFVQVDEVRQNISMRQIHVRHGHCTHFQCTRCHFKQWKHGLHQEHTTFTSQLHPSVLVFWLHCQREERSQPREFSSFDPGPNGTCCEGRMTVRCTRNTWKHAEIDFPLRDKKTSCKVALAMKVWWMTGTSVATALDS